MRIRGQRYWKKAAVVAALIMTAALLGGCGSNRSRPGQSMPVPTAEPEEESGTGFVVAGPNSYDSADTAVLVSKNAQEGTVTLLNLALGRRYTLSVNGTTTLYDKYGQAVSLEQLKPGDIVDVTFLRNEKLLNSMQLSSQAWVTESVSRYEFDMERQNVTIGSDVYKLSGDALFFSDGRIIEAMDVSAGDVVTFRGIGSSVLSVTVEKGHGYLRLTGDENFVGGFIEVGQALVRRIEEGMLLTVPEGSYQVVISQNGGGGIKDVAIRRNEEVTLDIGDLEIPEEEIKYGTVIFSLSPTNIILYIDGEVADTSAPVTLEYGMHQIIARADHYKSITTYLRVGQALAAIDITLDRADNNDDDDDNHKNSYIADYYRVYIDAPEDVEVYLDGNYIGITPVNFRKEVGMHSVTLRRSGYVTRSYTISVDDGEKDISYSFADLVKSDEENPEATASPYATPDPYATPWPYATADPSANTPPYVQSQPYPTSAPSGGGTDNNGDTGSRGGLTLQDIQPVGTLAPDNAESASESENTD